MAFLSNLRAGPFQRRAGKRLAINQCAPSDLLRRLSLRAKVVDGCQPQRGDIKESYDNRPKKEKTEKKRKGKKVHFRSVIHLNWVHGELPCTASATANETMAVYKALPVQYTGPCLASGTSIAFQFEIDCTALMAASSRL